MIQATQNHPTQFNSLLTLLIGVCALGLLCVWALPETIGLRHVLLGLGFLSSLILLKNNLGSLVVARAWPFWLLLCLYLWLILHLWLFSEQPSIQFHELRSIWLRSLLTLPLGIALGIYLSKPDGQWEISPTRRQTLISFLLFLGFSSTFLIFTGTYLYKCYVAQQWIPMQAIAWWSIPYREKPPFVVATALLLPLCCVLLLRVFRGKEGVWWTPLTLIAISLCVASNYLTNTKNGMAMVAITVNVFAAYSIFYLVFRWARHSVAKGIICINLATCLIAGVAWGVKLHFDKNPAWSQMISNAKVGVDIDHQNYWKNRNVYSAAPINEHGAAVDISTYERTAWFTAGLRLLANRPQGFGLVHHSFGWMALERWSDFYPPIGTLRGMTHSGWMDLALGIGIPGLLLILIPLGVSWYRSLKMNSLWGSYASWGIPIFTLTYLTTEVTGAHHFIELMVFMTALFVGITLIDTTQTPKSRTSVTQSSSF